MIFIVIIPAWIWIILLSGMWVILVHHTYNRIGFRHSVMMGLLGILGLQIITVSSNAIATSLDPISKFACMLGIFGMPGSIAIAVVQAGILGFLYRIWPQKRRGSKLGLKLWLLIWIILSLIIFLVHMRSAAMCTV